MNAADPTVTDRELAELERMYPPPYVHVPRLIAALRASREQQAELLAAVEDAAFNCRHAIDPFRAPEDQRRFIDAALRYLDAVNTG